MSTWTKTQVTGLYLHEPSGFYYYRFSLSGKRTFKSLKTSQFANAKAKALKLASETEDARQRGVRLESDLRTLADLARLYRARLKLSQQAASTKANYESWLRRLEAHWPGDFSAARPASVSTDRIVALREAVIAEGYAPAVVNQTVSMLATLLRLAVEKSMILRSPFDDSRMESVWLTKGTRVPKLPSRAELEKIFAEIRRSERVKKRAFDREYHARFLAASGMRLEEGNAAVWEDVGEKMLRVRGTKTEGSARHIPIFPALRTVLDAIRVERGSEGRDCRGRILCVGTSLKALRRACRNLGLPAVRHHDLRHYFVTTAIEAGVDIPTIARWVGHSDGGALLMKTYGHLRAEHSLAAAKKLPG